MPEWVKYDLKEYLTGDKSHPGISWATVFYRGCAEILKYAQLIKLVDLPAGRQARSLILFFLNFKLSEWRNW